MLDFALLPPEVNSARMYAGPGSGPLLAAAACWNGLAAELETTAVGYTGVIAGLTGQVWFGPTSTAMAAAVTPYVGWLSATSAAAVQTAVNAYAAAAAYEAAFAMTVPPAVVAANRSLLMALIATNFLGQNAAAIAACEAQYMEMWTQDATAMYGYACACESVGSMKPFREPPPTTKGDGRDGQGRKAGHTPQRGGDRGHRGHDGSNWRHHRGTPPSKPTPTNIGPGSANVGGPNGATLTVNEGTVTVGTGSTINVPAGVVTGGPSGGTIYYPEFGYTVIGANQTVQLPYSGATYSVTSGSVTVPAGSTVTVGPGGSITGGVQSGATITVSSGSIVPAAPVVTPTTATPAAAAPATTTASATSTTSTTSSASTSSSTSSSSSTSGTTSAGTSTPAGQQAVPGAQPQSAPAAQPQASGVAQAAPGLAPPHAIPGLAAPLAAPGGVVAAVGGTPAAPLGDPLQWISEVHPAPGDASNVALGDHLGAQLPLVRTDQVVLTSGATLLGAGGGGFTTFASTKATFYRGETVVTKTQHEALMRDASLHFVKSLDMLQSEISLSSTIQLSAGLDGLMSSNQTVSNLFELVKAGGAAATASQAFELLSGTTGSTPITLEQIATATLRSTLGAAPQMAEINDMIIEMKMIMPSDVLLKAQYAAIVTVFAAHIAEGGTSTNNANQAASAAVTDFIDAVRSDFGLDPIALV